jgi:hypothetical protein
VCPPRAGLPRVQRVEVGRRTRGKSDDARARPFVPSRTSPASHRPRLPEPVASLLSVLRIADSRRRRAFANFPRTLQRRLYRSRSHWSQERQSTTTQLLCLELIDLCCHCSGSRPVKMIMGHDKITQCQSLLPPVTPPPATCHSRLVLNAHDTDGLGRASRHPVRCNRTASSPQRPTGLCNSCIPCACQSHMERSSYKDTLRQSGDQCESLAAATLIAELV